MEDLTTKIASGMRRFGKRAGEVTKAVLKNPTTYGFGALLGMPAFFLGMHYLANATAKDHTATVLREVDMIAFFAPPGRMVVEDGDPRANIHSYVSRNDEGKLVVLSKGMNDIADRGDTLGYNLPGFGMYAAIKVTVEGEEHIVPHVFARGVHKVEYKK